MNKTETMLIEQKDLRNQCVDRIEVLEKVKRVFLIPKLEMMTIKQVADYYGVGFEAIKSIYYRNKEEIDSDGTTLKTLDFWKLQFETSKSDRRGFSKFKIDENTTIEINNRGIHCFPKRAILRIGMLLQDSEIAKEVRTQLLNTFEHATDDQRTVEINNEQELYIKYAKAAIEGSKDDLLYAAQEVFAYKNRYITELQAKVENLEPKGAYYDIILQCKNAISITQIAKDYGKSGSWMNSLLRKLKVQYYQNGTYLLYQKYAGNGYTITKTFPYEDKYGRTRATIHTYWTQAGRKFIYELLKKEGILPCVEQEK